MQLELQKMNKVKATYPKKKKKNLQVVCEGLKATHGISIVS